MTGTGEMQENGISVPRFCLKHTVFNVRMVLVANEQGFTGCLVFSCKYVNERERERELKGILTVMPSMNSAFLQSEN